MALEPTAGRATCRLMHFLALLLVGEATLATLPPPDELAFEILVGSGSAVGFRVDATERVEQFDNNPHRAQTEAEVSRGKDGTFAKARDQFARYRALADEPCTPTTTDVIAFRLTWRESGTSHTATFADSCKGIPDDLVATMRPVVEMIESQDKRSDAGVVELYLDQ